MSDWDGQAVIRGFAEEIFDRLPADAVAARADRNGVPEIQSAPLIGKCVPRAFTEW